MTYNTHRKKYHRKEIGTAALFLLPCFAIFIIFKYFPLLDNFRVSLTSWNLFSSNKKFVGLQNYLTIFTSPQFWLILKNTFVYTIGTTSLSLFFGFITAIILYRKNSIGSKIIRTVFFIPNITTTSAVSILWIWIFDPDYGLSGQIFSFFGAESPRWLLTPGYAMGIVISLSVWRSIGYCLLIFISGLSGISDEIYEAASIDGATGFQTIVKVTIPLLAPTTYFLFLTSIIQAMQVFDIVSVMTGGGPFNTTNVLNLYIYQTAFARFRAGSAAAMSVILFLILLFFTIIQRKASREKAYS
jgi:ABC-type sugar transport system permease subunit